jgi:hypothetical protein
LISSRITLSPYSGGSFCLWHLILLFRLQYQVGSSSHYLYC